MTKQDVLNSLKAAVWTTVFAFLGALAVLSLSWLTDLANWANSGGQAELPNLSTIGFAVLSAALAAAGGFLNFVVRAAQAAGWIPGGNTVPKYK